MDDFILVTTNNIEGYRVIKYISPVTANVVIGTHIINDLFAGFSDLFGGRSNTYQNKFSEMYNIAIDELKEEALKKGANCILGIKIDLDQISGKGMQMFMLNAIGTAVIIKTDAEYLEMKNNEKAEIENKTKKEEEQKERIKNIADLFKDESIMKEARNLRRLYGKGMYISHLKSKAKELGLGDIDLEEADVE
jgi:uncharacterized protein YbjQ (UPF0145 family)